MAEQAFYHVEGYARKAGKGKAGGHSISSVVDEQERKTGACPHVDFPKLPILLFGTDPRYVLSRAELWAEFSQDAIGRKIRIDGLCMASGVVSGPEGMNDENWQKYRDESIAWLKKKYGVRLCSIVEHTDESHRHIHFLAVPKLGENFGAVHAGHAAYENRPPGISKTVAFRSAMEKEQDQFHAEIGIRWGLTRFGPKRKRLTRKQWHAEKKLAELQACLARTAEEKFEKVDAMEAKLAQVQVEAQKAQVLTDDLQRRVKAERSLVDCVMAERDAARDEARKIKSSAKEQKALFFKVDYLENKIKDLQAQLAGAGSYVKLEGARAADAEKSLLAERKEKEALTSRISTLEAQDQKKKDLEALVELQNKEIKALREGGPAVDPVLKALVGKFVKDKDLKGENVKEVFAALIADAWFEQGKPKADNKWLYREQIFAVAALADEKYTTREMLDCFAEANSRQATSAKQADREIRLKLEILASQVEDEDYPGVREKIEETMRTLLLAPASPKPQN